MAAEYAKRFVRVIRAGGYSGQFVGERLGRPTRAEGGQSLWGCDLMWRVRGVGAYVMA